MKRATHLAHRRSVACGQQGRVIKQSGKDKQVTCKKCLKKMHRGIQLSLEV